MINLASEYKCKPSDIMHCETDWEAFCLDEACAYYVKQIKDGRTPCYETAKVNRKQSGAINSISEWYASMGLGAHD